MAWYDYIPTIVGGPIGGYAYNEIAGSGGRPGDAYNSLDNWMDTEKGAASLPYFEQDRARLQQLMDRGNVSTRNSVNYGQGGQVGRAGWGFKGPTLSSEEVQNPYGPYSTASQVGKDPRAGEINANLQRVLATAEGRGPSLADQQYRAAHQEQVASMASLAAGGRGAQGARFAANNIGRAGAGLAAGVAEARTREQMAAQSAYNQALQSAQGSDLQRDSLNAQLSQQTGQANQQAYMQMLAAQLGLSEAQLRAQMANGQLPSNADRVMNMMGTIGGAVAGGGAGGAAGAVAGGGVGAKQMQGGGMMGSMTQPGYAPSPSNTIRTGPPVARQRPRI